MNKIKVGRAVGRGVWLVVMSIFSLIMVYPFLFSLMASLNTIKEFSNMGNLFPWPSDPQWRNYATVFSIDGLRPLMNTVFRTAWYTIIACVMAMLVGYCMARYNFRLKKLFLFIILGTQIIPGVLTMIPTFVMVARIPLVGGNDIFGQGGSGLINNPLMLYLPLGWGYLLWVFLFMQSMKSLPIGFEEAAEIDGCGFFRKLFQIVLPMQKSILAVIGVNVALGTWNDWMTPFMYINKMKDSTLPAYVGVLTAALQQFGEKDYPKVFAVSCVAMVPPFLIFLFLQKHIIQGIASAGVKG